MFEVSAPKHGDPGLLCAESLVIPGFIDIFACSECQFDEDCPGSELCAPVYQLLELSAFRVCVLPGSLPLGAGCDLEGSGAASCQSGSCAGWSSPRHRVPCATIY